MSNFGVSPIRSSLVIARVFVGLLGRRPTPSELDRYQDFPLADFVLQIVREPEFLRRSCLAAHEAIVQIFRVMLGRDPDEASIRHWLPGSHAELVEHLAGSAEFQARRRITQPEDVAQAYRALLGREIGPDEVAQGVGQPTDWLYAQLVLSAEFRARRRAAEPEDVVQAYRALLGREIGPDEVAPGVGQPIDRLYAQLVSSAEFQVRRRTAEMEDVAQAYRALLGREIGPDEVAQGVGQPTDWLYAQLVSSAEFRARRRTAEMEDVAQAYRALLGREIGPDEVAQGVGQPIDRLYAELVSSAEFRARRRAAEREDVVQAYRALLGREIVPDEVAQGVGQPVTLMYETIAKSAEYLGHQAARGRSDSTIRAPQLNPPPEKWDRVADGSDPDAFSDAFKAFVTVHRQSLNDLNQYGVAYAAQLFDLFDGLIDRNTRCVVEYGSGLSTFIIQELLFQKTGTAPNLIFLSIDHNESWQRRVAQALPPRSFTHLRTHDLIGRCETTDDVGFNYATAPLMLQRKVDLAFVDGRTRAQSVLAVATCLDKRGTIVLDDRERQRYEFLDRYFKEIEARGRLKIFKSPTASPPRKAAPKKRETRAILRVVSGPQATIEASISRASVQDYADKCRAALVDVNIDQTGDEFPLAKLTLSNHLTGYDRVLLMDCDLVIRRNTMNLFDLVPPSHVGAVREDRFIDRSSWLDLMADLYEVPASIAGTSPYFNSGVLLLSRRHYDLLRLPEDKVVYAHPLFEQTYLNARIRELGIPLYELPKEYNYIPQYDAEFDFDWRFGSIIHLAGGQQSVTDAWRRKEFWEELRHQNGIGVRRQSQLLFRHVRVPYLRCLAQAIEHGHDYRIITAPDLEFKNLRRLMYCAEHGVLGLELSGAGDEVIASGKLTGVRAQAYRGEIRVLQMGAGRGPLTFELLSANENGNTGTTVASIDEDNVARFRYILLDETDLELRVRSCEGFFFESLVLIAEPNDDASAVPLRAPPR